ncbi:Uncharacterized protein BM_BM12792 [Brugia malayi]|uniref:Bm12792 n=2 Tax=Brugia malayi TaxID=6279 RepID=A0A4E9FEH9_BRUMA|nr:Uncharacterized protein BM_BM12792 [Brugia malayi]VIO95217.1 Uncharacterized protein BM_BM12792 [Brugia malayi]
MLPFLITKYLIALTVLTTLLMTETDAQLFNLNVLSFNNNRAGNNSLNANGNAGIGAAATTDRRVPENQNQQSSFGTWHTALGAGLGFLAGSYFGSSSSSSPSYELNIKKPDV